MSGWGHLLPVQAKENNGKFTLVSGLLNTSLDFVSSLSADQVEAAISEIEKEVKKRYPAIRRVFIEAQSWSAHTADRTASVEQTA